MRRALLLTALVTAAAALGAFDLRPSQAVQMCSTTCSGGVTIKCCVATGTCSSSGGSLDCAGVSHTCADYDAANSAYNSCLSSCQASYNVCASHCTTHTFTCLAPCVTARNNCEDSCQPPQTNFGC
jgi:hypothetical protein